MAGQSANIDARNQPSVLRSYPKLMIRTRTAALMMMIMMMMMLQL